MAKRSKTLGYFILTGKIAGAVSALIGLKAAVDVAFVGPTNTDRMTAAVVRYLKENHEAVAAAANGQKQKPETVTYQRVYPWEGGRTMLVEVGPVGIGQAKQCQSAEGTGQGVGQIALATISPAPDTKAHPVLQKTNIESWIKKEWPVALKVCVSGKEVTPHFNIVEGGGITGKVKEQARRAIDGTLKKIIPNKLAQ